MQRILAVALAAAVGAGGCDETAGPPAPRPQAKEAPKAAEDTPEIPGDKDTSEDAGSPILVTPLAPGEKREGVLYAQDETLPSGSVLGLCYVACKKPLRLPEPEVIRVAEGPNAIRSPEPKELAYYQKIRLARPRWIHAFNGRQRGHPVSGAVVLFRGIRRGPRPPLSRGGFQVNNGRILPRVGFSPVHDRIEIRTLDAFSNRFVLTDLTTGAAVWEKTLAGNKATFQGHGALDKHKLIAWSWTQWVRKAVPIQTEPMRKMGVYRFTCRRHPWQVACVVVVDNPYVAVPLDQHRRWGLFSINKVPVGTWEVDAWHPVLEPVRRTRTVEIKRDETLELGVVFKIPPHLRPATERK